MSGYITDVPKWDFSKKMPIAIMANKCIIDTDSGQS